MKVESAKELICRELIESYSNDNNNNSNENNENTEEKNSKNESSRKSNDDDQYISKSVFIDDVYV
jgi:hypothetical protein